MKTAKVSQSFLLLEPQKAEVACYAEQRVTQRADNPHCAKSEKMMLRLLATLALTSVAATSAFADRPVTPEERTQLVAALKAEGCSGGELEFDDGKFEVDDAVCADGKKYDLDFDRTFKLIKKELDD